PYAKPDIVAPGHRMVATAALHGTLYQQYPTLQVVGKTGDIARYMRLSGTSMATAVTSGSIALLLDAAGGNKALFTPTLVKAILAWSAVAVPGYDVLTQGMGAINAIGALALTRKIDPTRAVGSYWLKSLLTPSTTISNTVWPWSQTIVWGNNIVRGN